MTDSRLYRSPLTGLEGEYHPRVAKASGLIEVIEGEDSFAIEPIPQAAETELGPEPAEWAGPAGDAETIDDSEADEDSSASDVKE